MPVYEITETANSLSIIAKDEEGNDLVVNAIDEFGELIRNHISLFSKIQEKKHTTTPGQDSAVLAAFMKCEAHMMAISAIYQIAEDIIDRKTTAGDLGFPEFDDGSNSADYE